MDYNVIFLAFLIVPIFVMMLIFVVPEIKSSFIPPCGDCKHCREMYNTYYRRYKFYCDMKRDEISGNPILCSSVRGGSKCRFEEK